MKKLAIIISILGCFSVVADSVEGVNPSSVWQDVGVSRASNSTKHRNFLLDESSLKNSLNFSANAGSGDVAARTVLPEISLPLPDGSFTLVTATPSQVISAEMSEAYPEIKTWDVVGVDNSSISGVIDFTVNGFSGMLMMPDGDTVYIDPNTETTGDSYKSFSKRENISEFSSVLNCSLHEVQESTSFIGDSDTLFQSAARAINENDFPNVSIANRKTYRLALAATAEYTAVRGGTAAARASMVTSVNRINPVFQRDVGVNFELIDAPELIFSDVDTDPFSDPNDPAGLMIENGEYLSEEGRLDDFDLGHVLSFRPAGGGSGVAFLNVACQGDVRTNQGTLRGLKALGATTSAVPVGATFDLTLLAHEIGHQLGAHHTFNGINGFCNDDGRSAEVAVEPGSGSSIMSYNGTCGTDNIPNTPQDSYFHFASISQMNQFVRFGGGANCGTTEGVNEAATADAGADFEIPANTPFMLSGVASGGLSSWDQIDTGTPTAVDVDAGDNAIIRHNIPSTDEDRYIPNLSNLFNGTSSRGEILPNTTRELNFAYVVRDEAVRSDKTLINVTDTQSIFEVNSQSQDSTFTTNESVDISWNVADTDQAPINCSDVNIELIEEDGTRYILLESTDNDGSQSIIVPNDIPELSDARVFVGCNDNTFFNISSGEISVEAGEIQDVIAPVITLNGDSEINILEGADYNEPGAVATDDIDGDVDVIISGDVDTDTAGEYLIIYEANDDTGNTTTVTRVVNVVEAPTPINDETAPIITLNGTSDAILFRGEDYTDEGATAVDDIDGVVNVTSTGSVNSDVLGTYIITYVAVDDANNTATETRTVNVISLPRAGSFEYLLLAILLLLGIRRVKLNVHSSGRIT